MRFEKLFAAAVVLLFPAAASAAPCTGASPFTDVAPGASYCTNTAWLANRNITLGCGGTNFCPDLAVTRAAMGLFMNRLADALIMAPTVTEATFGGLTLTNAGADNAVCTTAPFPAVDYPRVFAATGHVTVLGSAGVATVAMQVSAGLNGTAPDPLNAFAQRVTTDSSYTANMSQPGEVVVPAGASVVFNIGLFTAGGTTAIGSGRCHLIVKGQSLTGTSSPFDRAARPSEGR